MSCSSKHTNIDTLYHVTPTPIEELPTRCSCGRPITYAETVLFLNEEVHHGSGIRVEDQIIHVTDMSWK